MILVWLTATWPKQKWLCSLLVRLWFRYDPQHQRYWLLLILPLLSDYLLLYLVSELEILSLVPFTRLFSAQPEQCKSTVVEMRIADKKSLRKNPVEKKMEKQMPDVQTKSADASSLWGNCSRTVNPYENMAHNTTKVSRTIGSAEEKLPMKYFCDSLGEKGITLTQLILWWDSHVKNLFWNIPL